MKHSVFTYVPNDQYCIISSNSTISNSFEDSNDKSNIQQSISSNTLKPNINENINETTLCERKDNSQNSVNSKFWNDDIILYIMLKYKKWQIKERKTISMNVFLETLSDDLQSHFRILKSSIQIRDKINNSKSAYSSIQKKLKENQTSQNNFQWKNGKYLSLSRKIFETMNIFYSNSIENEQSYDSLDKYILDIEKKFQKHFTVSSQLKDAILKMKC